jgi:tRNA dimethylallyltransferase
MRAVGYRQIWAYLDGITGFEEMVEQSIVATRQYAKRQLTWLRSENDIVSYAAETPLPVPDIAECLTGWLEQPK